MAATNISTLNLGVITTAAMAQFAPIQANGAPAVAAGNSVGFTRITATAAGQRVSVTALGTAIGISGGAIALGAALEVHTTVSQVVTRAAGVTIGRALNATAGAGEQVEVLLIPN